VEHINLKVLGQDGQVVHFKIKQHTSLKKLMSAYCARSKLAQQTVRFRFDGQAISENDTPQGLDMEDGDTIEVFQQQTGGNNSMSEAIYLSEVTQLQSELKYPIHPTVNCNKHVVDSNDSKSNNLIFDIFPSSRSSVCLFLSKPSLVYSQDTLI